MKIAPLITSAKSPIVPNLVEIHLPGATWHIHEIHAFGTFFVNFSSLFMSTCQIVQSVFTFDGLNNVVSLKEVSFEGLIDKNCSVSFLFPFT